MRILVVGCTGFVASHLTAALRVQFPGSVIYGASRGAPAASIMVRLHGHLALDLICEEEVRRAISVLQPDVTFHLATPRGGNLAHLLNLHVVGTANLLRAIRECGPLGARTLVVGSAAEIGSSSPPDLSLSETAPCCPADDYGIAKQAQSLLAQADGLRFRQPIVRIRLFNLLGPGCPQTLLPGRCAYLLASKAVRLNSEPLQFGSLAALRDYTDVRDICEALALAAHHGEAGRLYHVGSGQALSGLEIVRQLLAIAAPHTGPLIFYEDKGVPPMIPIQRADSAVAHQELGWRPKIDLNQSLNDMWQQALIDAQLLDRAE